MVQIINYIIKKNKKIIASQNDHVKVKSAFERNYSEIQPY